MDPLTAAAFFAFVGVLLLLHHGYKHSLEDPATSLAQQESCPEVCYFQLSDVGNVKTCNHEMWILLCFALAIVCFIWSLWISDVH